MTNTFTAVVRNSGLNGPQITITNDTGYVVLWMDVPSRSCSLTELVDRLRASDFEIMGDWVTLFESNSLSLVARVRSDRVL